MRTTVANAIFMIPKTWQARLTSFIGTILAGSTVFPTMLLGWGPIIYLAMFLPLMTVTFIIVHWIDRRIQAA